MSAQICFALQACLFFFLLLVGTFAVMHFSIAPELARLEGRLIADETDRIGIRVSQELRKVEAQQRSITQVVALLDSAQIDAFQHALVDQYGDPNIYGGGIWPLPGKRQPGRDKFSTFVARDPVTGRLAVNTHWNSPASLDYWEQPWYENGRRASRGSCNWAKAYRDDASAQPRTNCAMPIYKGNELYGVSTIDVTLGFFNDLVADMEKTIRGQILIVEADGKIVSNSSRIDGDIVLRNVSDIARVSPMAASIARLLPRMRAGAAAESAYATPDGMQTLFLKPIAGSPWFIATAIPSAMLATNSDRIMRKLVGAWCACSLLWACVGLWQYRNGLHGEKARVATLMQINQALQLESQQLADQVMCDPLTGALNRQGLREVLLKREHGDTGAYFDAVLFIDLDHFKQINDRFGHDAGDRVLKAFALTVSARIRESDKLVRWGGEEFLVLCTGVSGTQAVSLAQQLCAELAKTSWPHGLQVTASIGVAEIGGKADIGAAIRRADDAMYMAKRNGRNRVEIATQEHAGAFPDGGQDARQS